MFFQFILIVSILNILTGPIITSFLVHLMMTERMRDIGVMKASGCLSGLHFWIFCHRTFFDCLLQFNSWNDHWSYNLLLFHNFFEHNRLLYFANTQHRGNSCCLHCIIICSHIIGALPYVKQPKRSQQKSCPPFTSSEQPLGWEETSLRGSVSRSK